MIAKKFMYWADQTRRSCREDGDHVRCYILMQELCPIDLTLVQSHWRE